MAKSKDGINRSEEVRKLLAENPKLTSKEVQATLGERGITVSSNLVYIIKKKLKDAKRKERKAKVASVTGSQGDVLSVIRKVKTLADEVGGMNKLRSLVEVLS